MHSTTRGATSPTHPVSWRKVVTALALVATAVIGGLWALNGPSPNTDRESDESVSGVGAEGEGGSSKIAPLVKPTLPSPTQKGSSSLASGDRKTGRAQVIEAKHQKPAAEDGKAISNRLFGYAVSHNNVSDMELSRLVTTLAERSAESSWIRDDSLLIGDIATALVESQKAIRKSNSRYAQRLIDISHAIQRTKSQGRYLKPPKDGRAYPVTVSSKEWHGTLYIPASDSMLQKISERKALTVDSFLRRLDTILSARRRKR